MKDARVQHVSRTAISYKIIEIFSTTGKQGNIKANIHQIGFYLAQMVRSVELPSHVCVYTGVYASSGLIPAQTSRITPRKRVLIKMYTVAQLVNKSPGKCMTQMFADTDESRPHFLKTLRGNNLASDDMHKE